ncbi:MAG TPA: response regulator [Kineosporiaceae bacterium]|nr:response regulator [Kineosporiaceae bacterium]
MRTQAILLVEDDGNDVDMALWAFNQVNLDASIIVAQNGTEALELLLPVDRGHRLRPAMVLLDINVPGMGELHFLEHLRADPETKTLPVVVLTSSCADRDRIESFKLGANGYIQKPTSSAEFLHVAKSIGAFWLGVNLNPSSEN